MPLLHAVNVSFLGVNAIEVGGDYVLDVYRGDLEHHETPGNKWHKLVYNLAEAKAEMLAVETIRDGFKDDWRAAMAFLERRFRERWGCNIIGFNDDTGANDLVNAFASALSDVDEEFKNSTKH